MERVEKSGGEDGSWRSNGPYKEKVGSTDHLDTSWQPTTTLEPGVDICALSRYLLVALGIAHGALIRGARSWAQSGLRGVKFLGAQIDSC